MGERKNDDDYDLVDEWMDWNRARKDAEPYIVDKKSIQCLRSLIAEQIEMSVAKAIPAGFKLVPESYGENVIAPLAMDGSCFCRPGNEGSCKALFCPRQSSIPTGAPDHA